MFTLTRQMDEIAARIALDGIDRVPEAMAVAELMADRSPVAAGIVMAASEPTVARERAFARIAALVARIERGSGRGDEVDPALTWIAVRAPQAPASASASGPFGTQRAA